MSREKSFTTISVSNNATFAGPVKFGSSTSVKYTLNTPLTGASVALPANGAGLVLTPAATIAALTVTFPASSALTDGQTFFITCSQVVSALTVTGATFAANNGAPSALTAGQTLRFMYVKSLDKFVRLQ